MKIENKLLAGATTILVSIGLATNLGTNKITGCETYQSGRTDDGDTLLTFDEKPYEERGLNKPNYALLGYSKMLKELKEGERYKLEIRKPILPFSPERLLSFENCDQNSE